MHKAFVNTYTSLPLSGTRLDMWKLLLQPIEQNIHELQYLLALASIERSKVVHLQHIPHDQWNQICHHASAFVFSTMVWCMLNLTAGVR